MWFVVAIAAGLVLALIAGGWVLSRTSERTKQPSFRNILPMWNFLRKPPGF